VAWEAVARQLLDSVCEKVAGSGKGFGVNGAQRLLFLGHGLWAIQQPRSLFCVSIATNCPEAVRFSPDMREFGWYSFCNYPWVIHSEIWK
jgi:hypothetical protein